MHATARRILVYGVTGSGKSTAAQHVGRRTGLPVTLVDDLLWRPGWVMPPEDEQRATIADVVAGDAWVLDTAYTAWLDLVLPRVDVVVGLDYPRWFSLQRLLRRTVHRAATSTPVCNGNVETWANVVRADSILRWHFRSFASKRQRMRAWAADPDGPPVRLMTSPRRLEAWIATLPTPPSR